MKKITKIIIGSMFAAALLVGGQAYAQDAGDIKNSIAELRATHAELKAQVDAGELSAEEARATWKELIADARAKKEAYFEKRMEQAEAKYQEILANNPERAELFATHLENAKERRSDMMAKREELKAKVESGEITRQEARVMKVDFVKEQREVFKDIRADLKEKRNELRDGSNAGAVRPVDRPNAGAAPNAGAVRPRPVGANAGAVPNAGAAPFEAVNTLTSE